MIDIEKEEIFLLSKAGEHVGFPLSPATAYRWRFRGLRVRQAATAERVRLEDLKIGGRRYTSKEAICRFIARLSETGVAATLDPSAERSEQIAKAAKLAATTF